MIGSGKIALNGFFDLDIDNDSPTVIVVKITIYSISLLLQCVMGTIAIIKMRRDQNTSIFSNILFLLTVFCSCLYCICFIVLICISEDGDMDMATGDVYIQILFVTAYLSFTVFILSVLEMLILRLFLTFKDSVYQMSPVLIAVFKTLSFLIFGVFIAICILLIFTDSSFLFLWSLFFGGSILYMIGCVLAVYFFISNLSKLAKAREMTMRDLNIPEMDIKLDPHQQQLSDLAAKYMMLFVIAMGSSILTHSVFKYFVNHSSGLRMVFISIDNTVNLFCMYLQVFVL